MKIEVFGDSVVKVDGEVFVNVAELVDRLTDLSEDTRTLERVIRDINKEAKRVLVNN